jgi:sugar phosphate isomerase/epimerase
VTADLRALSVSYYSAPSEFGLDRFCELLARRGIGGVGLTAAAVEEFTPRQLAALLAGHGLRCTSLNSAGYFLHADAGRAARQAKVDAHLLDCAAVLGAPVNVISGGLDDAATPTSAVSLEEARRRVTDRLARLADTAAQLGVRLSLEPIHPLGVTDKGCINQLSQARSVIAGLPQVGLTLDLFHSWWDADLESTVRDATKDLFVVQVCGVETSPAGIPWRTDMADGHVDVEALIGLLSEVGWKGMVEFEVMYAQRPRDVVAVLDRTVRDFANLTGTSPAARDES